MVTYIKIGSCDEIKEWGKYDPIPATTECCCCGTTVIDIITPNKDKPIIVPDKPKEDTPTKPSENGGTDNGNVIPSNPTENNSGTDNGNTGTTEPTTPSDNGNTGNTDNGNSGSTDSGNTTPTQPSENGNTGNTDSGTTQPTEEPTVFNHIFVQDGDDGYSTLFELGIRGKVGETVVLGDEIKKSFNTGSINDGTLNSDGNFEKNGIVYVSDKIKPNLRDYIYTIKENGHDEEIPLVRVKPSTTFH